jgi:hypothetical protein
LLSSWKKKGMNEDNKNNLIMHRKRSHTFLFFQSFRCLDYFICLPHVVRREGATTITLTSSYR